MRLFTPYSPPAFLVDFLLNCGATLCATTLYSSSPWILNLLLLLPSGLVYVLESPSTVRRDVPRSQRTDDEQKVMEADPLPVKPFITNYRGAMMIITCIAILAVDFRVFPRRFAKVENWGTSLMDMGVGSFVFTAGVVSVRANLKTGASQPPPLSKRLSSSFRHSIPLLLLGIVRLITVKGLDYAEHVTEYGVHWNFFFTLGFLPPFVAVFQAGFALLGSYAVLSCTLAAIYEILLDWTTLGSYILIAPRTNLFSQNREGIFSFIGYLAIFLAGQSLGSFALPRERALPKGASFSSWTRQSILGKLIAASIVWTALFYFSTSYYGLRLSVSRRLANLPYVLWVSSFNSYQITICYMIESLLFRNNHQRSTKEAESRRSREATSTILHAFNRNGLAIFLAANLLTGLVNMTMPTLHMSVPQSMGVLVAYIAVLAFIAVGLDRAEISIKL